MLPEQIWDGADVPERELFRGRPSGSAMPLVWAHAEHLKLRRSLRDGKVYDLPPQTWQRYVVERTRSRDRDLAVQSQYSHDDAGRHAADPDARTVRRALERRRLAHGRGYAVLGSGLAGTTRTCRLRRSPRATRCSSRSAGRKPIAGRVSISESR